MTLMRFSENNSVEVLAGSCVGVEKLRALTPFSKEAVNFLKAWSRLLLSDPETREYADVISFAYWCRKANLNRVERSVALQEKRLGRGLVFHVAPANVPVNFAFSFAFGLLAGNGNIVRVSESLPVQAELMCRLAARLLKTTEHQRISDMTLIIRYAANDKITHEISGVSDARMLWGGDKTVNHLRSLVPGPRCVDLTFSDRFSVCILGAKQICEADAPTLKKLAHNFFNDVFLFDQNACSSPHLIFWQGTKAELENGQRRFWLEVSKVVSKNVNVTESQALDKYTAVCIAALNIESAKLSDSTDNSLHRVAISRVPQNIEELRGRHGFFYEVVDNELSQFCNVVNNRYQTVTVFGVKPDMVIQKIIDSGLSGIDRIVPVGEALNLSNFWDGFDLVRTLSRVVSTH